MGHEEKEGQVMKNIPKQKFMTKRAASLNITCNMRPNMSHSAKIGILKVIFVKLNSWVFMSRICFCFNHCYM